MDAIDTSKTHKFYLLLKERIRSGALPAGFRLPNEPTLAATHGLSRVTIRRALDGLARDGLITRQPGAGTFVASNALQPPLVADLSNMLAHLAAMGRSTKVRLLAFSFVLPPPPVASALRLAAGERAQHSIRVRSVDAQPMSYLSTYIPERIGRTYSKAELASTPLLELLERAGTRVDTADQTISATLAGPEPAAALDVEIGSPLIALTRVVLDPDGRGVEFLSALYRPDMHVFQMQMRRTGQGAQRHWQPVAKAMLAQPLSRRKAVNGTTIPSTGPQRVPRQRATQGRRPS